MLVADDETQQEEEHDAPHQDSMQSPKAISEGESEEDEGSGTEIDNSDHTDGDTCDDSDGRSSDGSEICSDDGFIVSDNQQSSPASSEGEDNECGRLVRKRRRLRGGPTTGRDAQDESTQPVRNRQRLRDRRIHRVIDSDTDEDRAAYPCEASMCNPRNLVNRANQACPACLAELGAAEDDDDLDTVEDRAGYPCEVGMCNPRNRVDRANQVCPACWAQLETEDDDDLGGDHQGDATGEADITGVRLYSRGGELDMEQVGCEWFTEAHRARLTLGADAKAPPTALSALATTTVATNALAAINLVSTFEGEEEEPAPCTSVSFADSAEIAEYAVTEPAPDASMLSVSVTTTALNAEDWTEAWVRHWLQHSPAAATLMSQPGQSWLQPLLYWVESGGSSQVWIQDSTGVWHDDRADRHNHAALPIYLRMRAVSREWSTEVAHYNPPVPFFGRLEQYVIGRRTQWKVARKSAAHAVDDADLDALIDQEIAAAAAQSGSADPERHPDLWP